MSTGSTWAGMAEAFTIFAKYGEGDHETCAEHDIIYSGPDSKKVSAKDLKRLEELGWRPASEGGFSKFV